MKRTFIAVLFRGLSKMIDKSYKNSKNRIGETIKLKTSDREYTVFKQSDIKGKDTKEGVYFEVEFSFKKWVPNYFSPTIPFFIGMPGFISKLWLIDNNNGDYAGQYIFSTRGDAQGYGNSFAQKLVKNLCVQGKHKWEVTEIEDTQKIESKSVKEKIPNNCINGIFFL